MSLVAVGSDHAGFSLKAELAGLLVELGHEVRDIGVLPIQNSDTPNGDPPSSTIPKVDYPDFGAEVARLVASGEADFGVCVCGSGLGIAMAANRVPGVRAAPLHDVTTARLARQHNDANVACFGERLISARAARKILRVFCSTKFEGGRHEARVAKLDNITQSQPLTN